MLKYSVFFLFVHETRLQYNVHVSIGKHTFIAWGGAGRRSFRGRARPESRDCNLMSNQIAPADEPSLYAHALIGHAPMMLKVGVDTI